ncbi:MAG: F0F1 ATP synthase subunit gamma [Alphaproteobacteria bacterium]|nr:F0F1 ATP synthase subunit gamma [Alphaproteobacteria bacterium]
MEGLEALQKRIKTTQDLRSIVSTMKSLSAVSIIQYDTALRSLIDYGKTIDLGMLALIKRGVVHVPVQRKASIEKMKALAVVIGSDTGMVGRINRDTVSLCDKLLKRKTFLPENIFYIPVGRQVIGILENSHRNNIVGRYPISNSVKSISATATNILLEIDKFIRNQGITHVFLFYSQKRGSYIKSHSNLLVPMGEEWLKDLETRKWEGKGFPNYSMDSDKLFSSLIQEKMMMTISTALTDALSAEHHMRLTTMQAAEKNIDENLEIMHQTYQQMRQENITTELLDVVNGAEAMRKKK